MIYWIIFSLTAVLSIYEILVGGSKASKTMFYVLCFFLVLFVGLRYDSVDYFSYQEIWERVDFTSFSIPFYLSYGGSTGNEFIFATILSFIKSLGGGFEFFIFLIALMSLCIKLHFFRVYSPYVFISIFIYLSFSLFKEMGQIRNALSAAIFLFAIKPMAERKLASYTLITLVSFGVQASTFIGFFAYWLYPLVKRKYYPYLILASAFLVSIFGGIASVLIGYSYYLPFQLSSRALSYFSKSEPLSYNYLNISMLIFAIVLLWLRNIIIIKNKYLISLVTFHVYATSMYFLLFDFPVVAGRIIELLSFNSLAILLPVIISGLAGYKRFIFVIVIYFYMSLLFYSAVSSANSYKIVDLF